MNSFYDLVASFKKVITCNILFFFLIKHQNYILEFNLFTINAYYYIPFSPRLQHLHYLTRHKTSPLRPLLTASLNSSTSFVS